LLFTFCTVFNMSLFPVRPIKTRHLQGEWTYIDSAMDCSTRRKALCTIHFGTTLLRIGSLLVWEACLVVQLRKSTFPPELSGSRIQQCGKCRIWRCPSIPRQVFVVLWPLVQCRWRSSVWNTCNDVTTTFLKSLTKIKCTKVVDCHHLTWHRLYHP